MSCFNCNKRVLGCHDTCEEYAKYKKRKEDMLNAKKKHYENGVLANRSYRPKTNSNSKRELYL